MEIKASLKYLRIAPRKVRLVADLIRGKKVNEAILMLQFSKKRAAKPLLKLLKSALANAKNNFKFTPERLEKLYIKKIAVNEGIKLKRWRPVAMGSAHLIQKKTSHVELVLEEK
jgi:large subunit ribosomal protein L22